MCALWSRGKDKVDEAARRRAQVQDVLADIVDQRAKLKLEFDEGVTSLKNITANVVKHDAASIVVEVSALKSASETWVGAGIFCYFRIRDRGNPGHTQFLTFHARIQSVHQRPSGLVYFVLTVPEGVKLSQQRRCVRVQVDQSRVPSLSLWRELPSGCEAAALPPLLSSAAEARFRVGNISSIGLLLLVQNGLMREALPQLNPGERFSFYFEAVAEAETPAEPFWVNAVLRNIFSDPQQGLTSLGFEFVSEGAVDEEGRLAWQPLKSEEVGSLGLFIFKWNLLDFQRDKRVAAA